MPSAELPLRSSHLDPMKAVCTLPSWKRADSLFLCVRLTALVLRSTTPLPSPSPEKTSAPPQPKPRRSTPILLSWCVVLRSPHVAQWISPRSLKIHVRRFRNTPTPRTKYRAVNERIPLDLRALPSVAYWLYACRECVYI